MEPINPGHDPDAPDGRPKPPLEITTVRPNGTDLLRRVLEAAGYDPIAQAVASHALFLHPDTVAQTKLEALFPVVRNQTKRTQVGTLPDGREVMFDDNWMPIAAFCWSAGWNFGTKGDLQFNHVVQDSQEPRNYTALWNICVTPAFLAKATDGHPEVKAALRYRSHELYGTPGHMEEPTKPDGYDHLRWGPVTAFVPDLATVLRARLEGSTAVRQTTIRRLGWLFAPPTGETLQS